MNEQVRELVDSIIDGKSSLVRERLDTIVSAKAVDALEFKKIQVAKGFFGQKEDSE